MMKTLTFLTCATVALAGFAGCSNDPTVTNNPNGTTTTSNVTFKQIARIGRPGVKELYLPYASHDGFDRANPQNDVAAFAPAVGTFVTGTGGRTPAISTYVQALLAPDALVANLADTSTRASYLGFETSGQIASDCMGLPGTTFGGRALADDVVNTMLGLTFGSLATTTTLKAATPNVLTPIPPDDGAEQDGRPGRRTLTNQYSSCTNKSLMLRQFPYLGAPL